MLAAVEPRPGRPPRSCWRRLNDELRTVVHDVIRLTPNIVEVVVRAPIAARAFKPGQFYRLQNFESLAAGRRDRPGDGGARLDRSVGRPRARPALDDRPGDGRLVRPLRPAQARRADQPDGPDRGPDRDAGPGDGPPRSAAAWATPCCSRSASSAPGGGVAGDLLRRLQEDDRPLQGRGDREGGRRHRLVLGRGAGFHPGPGPGSGVRGQHRRGDGRLRPGRPPARPRSRSTRSTGSSSSAPTA